VPARRPVRMANPRGNATRYLVRSASLHPRPTFPTLRAVATWAPVQVCACVYVCGYACTLTRVHAPCAVPMYIVRVRAHTHTHTHTHTVCVYAHTMCIWTHTQRQRERQRDTDTHLQRDVQVSMGHFPPPTPHLTVKLPRLPATSHTCSKTKLTC